MNVHGYIVPEVAIDAAVEFMRTGATFDCKKLGKVIGRHFDFQKGVMSPEGYRTVCLDAAHRLMREMRVELELVRRSAFRTEHHHYRWRMPAQPLEQR